MLQSLFVIILITGGLLFARSNQDIQKVNDKNPRGNSKHYWIKNQSENYQNQLDRKRTHKRRRKIKKPAKGLR